MIIIITYRPGPLQGKPDALSRRSEFAPKEGDEAHEQQKSILLKPELIPYCNSSHPERTTMTDQLCAIYPTLTDDPVIKTIQADLPTDPWAQDIIEETPGPHTTESDPLSTPGLRMSRTDLLYYKGLLYVPAGPASSTSPSKSP